MNSITSKYRYQRLYPEFNQPGPGSGRPGVAAPQQPTDATFLSDEAREEDGRDRAIDDYYRALASDFGNTTDAKNFAELMAFVTKELKDIEKMDFRQAGAKFGETINTLQEMVEERHIGSNKPDSNAPPTEPEPNSKLNETSPSN